MFTIFGNAIACILWGVLIAVVLTIFLYVLMKMLHASFSLNLCGFFIMLLTFILFFAQGAMMAGAMYAKGYVDEMGVMVVNLINQTEQSFNQLAPVEQIRHIKHLVNEEYPVLSPYMKQLELSTVKEGSAAIAVTIVNEVKSLADFYMLRRVFWIVGIMLASSLLVGWIGKRNGTKNKYPHSVSNHKVSTYAVRRSSMSRNGF